MIPTAWATLVFFEPVFGTAVGVVTTEAALLLVVGMIVGRDAEEGRVGVGRMEDVDLSTIKKKSSVKKNNFMVGERLTNSQE